MLFLSSPLVPYLQIVEGRGFDLWISSLTASAGLLTSKRTAFRLFLDVTWEPVACPLERRIEELLGTLQPGDGLLVNELSLLGPRKRPSRNVPSSTAKG